MSIRRLSKKVERSPEEKARLRADRERYQRERPSIEQLLAEGGHTDTVPLGHFLGLQACMSQLKMERERQGLTLTQVAERTGIDQAALSRLETGKQVNTTVETLSRIADALGVEFYCGIRPPASAAQAALA